MSSLPGKIKLARQSKAGSQSENLSCQLYSKKINSPARSPLPPLRSFGGVIRSIPVKGLDNAGVKPKKVRPQTGDAPHKMDGVLLV